MSSFKNIVKNLPGIDLYRWSKTLYYRKKRIEPQSYRNFLSNDYKHIHLIRNRNSSAAFNKLCSNVSISPIYAEQLFYSLDPYITLGHGNRIYDNMTVNYAQFVDSSLDEILLNVNSTTAFYRDCQGVIKSLELYLDRLVSDDRVSKKYAKQIDMIKRMFKHKAVSFEEALQRILFINQWLWQTGHMDNGLGHLDWILGPYLKNDMDNEILTIDSAKELIKSFLRCLHEYYWFKSAQLAGDIGQIIILGGLNKNKEYEENYLTGLFIDCVKELGIPDPKVLLRTSIKMSDDLLSKAVDCIATGIGGPVFSNDDIVIPYLLKWGYTEQQAYNYVTAACWEPMIIDGAVEQNNIASLNFVKPLIRMCDDGGLFDVKSFDDIIDRYINNLTVEITEEILELETLRFEKDPYVSFCLKTCVENSKDVSKIDYNLGLTGVGMSTVINSLLNIKRYVYEEKSLSLGDFNSIRKSNFEGKDPFIEELKANNAYGGDNEFVVTLTNQILDATSKTFDKINMKSRYKYKFGLSSPRYIIDSQDFPATFDGRRNNEPFEVHISSLNAIAPTELLTFASKLIFGKSGYNANVVDFILPPTLLNTGKDTVCDLIRGAHEIGVFQIQINVVSSEVLIDAQVHPDSHKDLIVRVWGFSAYFVELPKEYQDNLIRRVKASEVA